MRKQHRISTHEPVTHLRKIVIVECGEKLVDFLSICPALIFDRPRWNYRREHLLRESVAERLCRAANALPKGFRFAVLEGWRPKHIQKRMYQAAWNLWQERYPDWSESALKRLVNRFTAPLDERVPPPHTTGGAVDLFLADESGNLLDLVSPYELRDRKAFPFDAKNLSKTAKENRQIMKEALAEVGITNYPSEYWHYSYGDQGWAYRGSHPHAIYGPIAPDGYTPDPGDDINEPLTWVDQ
jgi:D-alanyl-D-alanine dipeptidase